jgi:hypothetical protein
VDEIPDWALMDLFTVPLAFDSHDKPLVRPDGHRRGGLVNVNSVVAPFEDPAGTPLFQRRLPLEALLLNATSAMTATAAATTAANIDGRIRASGGQNYGAADFYYSPGQIVEIKDVADKGESSEELIRRIASLATARGNVFSIHSVGQALKQDPTGKVHVLGDRRQLTIVERNTGDGGVTLSTIYSRSINP